MNFRICSSHDPTACSNSFLRRGTILEFPEELKGFLNSTVDEFQAGLLHMEFHHICKSSVYSYVSGMCVFYHKNMNRTCHMQFISDHIQASPTLTGCITCLFNLTWDGDTDFVNYLAILTCKIKLHTVPWRHIIKDDTEYVAVPHSATERMTMYIKQRLLALSVQFHHSVSIQNSSQRCLLIPSALIDTSALPFGLDKRLWTLVALQPSPVVHEQSDGMVDEFGISIHSDTPLSEVLSRHHNPEECKRIETNLMPVAMTIEDGCDTTFSNITFYNGAYSAHVFKVQTCLIFVYQRTSSPKRIPEWSTVLHARSQSLPFERVSCHQRIRE